MNDKAARAAQGDVRERGRGGDVSRSEVRSARFSRAVGGAPVPLSPETMESLFSAPGWSVKQIHHDTWQGRVRTEAGYFQVLAHFGVPMALVDLERIAPELSGDLPFDLTLQIAIVPYLVSPEDPTRCNALYQRLLSLNHQMFGVRFAIDDDLDVLLGVECPTRTLTWDALVDARDALVHYAEAHFAELSGLCLPGVLARTEIGADVAPMNVGGERSLAVDEVESEDGTASQ